MQQIKQTIASFVKGGDTNDKDLLDRVVHPQYQNIQDGFFKDQGIYVFSKAEYFDLVDRKTFGGSPPPYNMNPSNKRAILPLPRLF